MSGEVRCLSAVSDQLSACRKHNRRVPIGLRWDTAAILVLVPLITEG